MRKKWEYLSPEERARERKRVRYAKSVWHPAAEGYVYAVHDTDRGLIKIGCTTKPISRIRSVGYERKKTRPRTPLTILGVVRVTGPRRVEQVLHDHFGEYRVSGEWFRLHPIDILSVFTPEKIRSLVAKELEENKRLIAEWDALEKQRRRASLQQAEIRIARGKRLRNLRKAKGWSRKDLSQRSGISYSTLADLEHGMRRWPWNPEYIQRLAQTLDVSTGVLINLAVFEDPDAEEEESLAVHV